MLGMICFVLAALLSVDARAGVVLSAPALYHGAGRPIICELEFHGEASASLEVVLLDAEGTVLAGPAAIRAGRFDLRESFPAIADLNRAAWLQVLADGTATGTPLIVQPLLSRQVPEVVVTSLPGGATMTRITGWRDELDRASPSEGDSDTDSGAEAPPVRPALPIRSGFRIYSDRDVVLETSEGVIRVAMRPDHAPNTVWNMRHLVEGGLYRDMPFHRIVPLDRTGQPFVIQAGDPSGTGSGGPGYWLPMERSQLPHDFGVFSMARDLPVDSAGSQFFICLSRAGTARLDGHYCAFGQTVEGGDVIRRLADVELADVTTGRPRVAPIIRRARLEPAPPRVPGVPRPVVREMPKDVRPPEEGRRIDR